MSKTGSVLYVGKAKNLKHRVSSYKQISPDNPKTFQLVNLAHRLKFQELESDLQALLTEAELIRTHQPKYNILLKDDKTPLYIIITKEQFPRVLTARKKQLTTIYHHLPNNHVFGPFSSGKEARRVIKLSRRIFKFCNQNPKTGKPCFYTHINLCSGACQGNISQKDYQHNIKLLKLFLGGRRNSLVKKIKAHMNQLAEDKLFEQAATLRDQLISINHLYQQSSSLDQNLPIIESDTQTDSLQKTKQVLKLAGLIPASHDLNRIEAYDISNTSGQHSTASMVVFTGGKPNPSQYRHFKIHLEGPNDYAMLKEALTRRLNHPEWDYPDLILIDGGKGQLRASLSVIGTKIPTVSIAKRPDRLIIPIFQDAKLTYRVIRLKPGHPTSNLIQSLRDESHRFAKNYHTKLRNKAMLNS